MTVKMSEKIMWSTFMGRLTEFELKNPPWDFHGLKYMFIYLQTYYEKHWILHIYFTEFFGFRFLTRVPMGNYLPVWALYATSSIHNQDISTNNVWFPVCFFLSMPSSCSQIWQCHNPLFFYLKDLCNANACWLVLIYNTLIITNVAKRLFKYVPYILL